MLLTFATFGGIIPKITDPRLIPPGKGQVAKNCRFDHGGITPLGTDATAATPTVTGPILTIFLYTGDSSNKWLAWASDVDAVLAPLANDSWKRVFYTESGYLRVTDKTLYKQGGTAYPMVYRDPSPPAPATPIVATVLGLSIAYNTMVLNVVLDSKGVLVTIVDNGMSNISSNNLVKLYDTGITGLDGVSFAFTGLVIVASPPTASFYVTGLDTMNAGTITGITKASPPHVTCAGHKLLTGDILLFSVVGMTELNGFQGAITVINDSTFSIDGEDSTLYGTFTSGSWTLQSRILASGSPPSPVFTPVTITSAGGDNITKANPAKVHTHLVHGLVTGDTVRFLTMVGMTQLENYVGLITVVDTKNFTLDDLNSTAYGTFTSGTYCKCASLKVVDADPTTLESKSYVQTFVNGYGEEGPPGPVSNEITLLDGDHVYLTGLNTAPATGFWVLYSNIYRLNQDANGNEVFQLVEQVAVATTTYTDTLFDVALADVLKSAEWDGVPSGAKGLVALPNEGLACYFDNTICLSVPSYPHAWPVSYQKSTECNIMGFIAWGITLVALTTGEPEALTFTDPANSVPQKIPGGHACLSKRSLVDMNGYSIYASVEGLIAMGQGLNKVLTADIFSRDDWAAYTPSTISAYYWEGKYVGFYTTGGVSAGFIFDPETGNFRTLDFYATAGYYDDVTGYLYLQVGANIVSFASVTATPRTMDWKSPREARTFSMYRWIKVLAVAYPVTVDIIYPLMVDGTGASAPQTVTVTVTSKNPQMLPMANAMVDAVECRIYGTKGVTVVYLASTLEEMPT